MRQTSQDEEQSQLAENGVAERGGGAQGLSDLFQRIQQAKDWTERGFGERRMIEVTPEGAAEGCDARKIPVGEIGQGAIFDFAVFAVGLAKENGGGRLAIGDRGYVHADQIQQLFTYVKENLTIT